MLADPVVLVPDDSGTLLVAFPGVLEAVTFGEDEGDALERIVDALDRLLDFDHLSRLDQIEPRWPLAASASISGWAMLPRACCPPRREAMWPRS